MEYRFSTFRVDERKNFLVKPYSKKHGEGYIIHDSMPQLGAGLLIENLGDATGMIVFVRDGELAYVVKNMGGDKVAYVDYHKAQYSEAGKFYKEMNVDFIGILIDCGKTEDNRCKFKILSKTLTDIV